MIAPLGFFSPARYSVQTANRARQMPNLTPFGVRDVAQFGIPADLLLRAFQDGFSLRDVKYPHEAAQRLMSKLNRSVEVGVLKQQRWPGDANILTIQEEGQPKRCLKYHLDAWLNARENLTRWRKTLNQIEGVAPVRAVQKINTPEGLNYFGLIYPYMKGKDLPADNLESISDGVWNQLDALRERLQEKGFIYVNSLPMQEQSTGRLVITDWDTISHHSSLMCKLQSTSPSIDVMRKAITAIGKIKKKRELENVFLQQDSSGKFFDFQQAGTE